MSLGVYFTLKSSQYLGSVFIGLGTMYKFLPILSVIPIWIVDFCEKRYRQIFFEMTIICAIIAVLFGPYLLTDSSLAIESVFFNGTKIPDSFSLFSIFQLNSEIIPFILQIGLLSIFFYTVIIHFNLFPANSYSGVFFFLAVFMLLNKNLYPHYYLWIFPFFAYSCIKTDKMLLLTALAVFNTILLSLFYIDYGQLVNSSPLLPFIFHFTNWLALYYILKVLWSEKTSPLLSSV
jgi:hypothetical protein